MGRQSVVPASGQIGHAWVPHRQDARQPPHAGDFCGVSRASYRDAQTIVKGTTEYGSQRHDYRRVRQGTSTICHHATEDEFIEKLTSPDKPIVMPQNQVGVLQVGTISRRLRQSGWFRERPQGAPVPRGHRQNQEIRAGRDIAHRCLVHGAPPCGRCRHRTRDRLPHLPRHRHHGRPSIMQFSEAFSLTALGLLVVNIIRGQTVLTAKRFS
jgi:hypothetical protein